MNIVDFRPSSLFCNINIHELFIHDDGHRYMLMARDAVKVYAVRWYWWNNILEKIARRFSRYAKEECQD